MWECSSHIHSHGDKGLPSAFVFEMSSTLLSMAITVQGS